MPARTMIEWGCDGCDAVTLAVHGEGAPHGWVAIRVTAARPNPVDSQVVVCPQCSAPWRRARVLAAILDPILPAMPVTAAKP